MDELISIIVPVYRVEKYLRTCAESILNQTYSNFELILADDGSDDASSQICDEIREEDKRVKVIHKKNGGLSDARNAGINIAEGKYLSFIDSDDIVHPEFLQTLLSIIQERDCDIAVCDILKFDNSDAVQMFDPITDISVDIKKPIECFYNTNAYYDAAWNKLYKRAIFGNIRYPYRKIHEDVYTTYKVFMNAKRIGVTDAKLYLYRQRNESITGSVKSVPNVDIEEALWERKNFFKAVDDESYAEAMKAYIFNACKLLVARKKGIAQFDEDKLDIISIRLRQAMKEAVCSSRVKIKRKTAIIIRWGMTVVGIL